MGHEQFLKNYNMTRRVRHPYDHMGTARLMNCLCFLIVIKQIW